MNKTLTMINIDGISKTIFYNVFGPIVNVCLFILMGLSHQCRLLCTYIIGQYDIGVNIQLFS